MVSDRNKSELIDSFVLLCMSQPGDVSSIVGTLVLRTQHMLRQMNTEIKELDHPCKSHRKIEILDTRQK